MNDRQRILMQKIAEYGDAKYMVGSDYSMHIDQGARINGALTLFREIEQMVTDWILEPESTTSGMPSQIAPTYRSDELGIDVGTDTRVTPTTAIRREKSPSRNQKEI